MLAPVLLQASLRTFADPSIFLMAIAVGWFARSAWVVLAGAVVIGALLVGLSVLHPLPEGATRIWWFEPIRILPALVWGFGVFLLLRWLTRRNPGALSGGNARAAGIVLGALAGGVAGRHVGSLLGGLVIEHLRDPSVDPYQVIISIIVGGVLVGIVAGGLLAWHLSRPRVARSPDVSPRHPGSSRRRSPPAAR